MIRDQQIDKISELFIDVAKGLFLVAFASQFFTSSDIIIFVKNFFAAVFATLLSLKILELKNKKTT